MDYKNCVIKIIQWRPLIDLEVLIKVHLRGLTLDSYKEKKRSLALSNQKIKRPFHPLEAKTVNAGKMFAGVAVV